MLESDLALFEKKNSFHTKTSITLTSVSKQRLLWTKNIAELIKQHTKFHYPTLSGEFHVCLSSLISFPLQHMALILKILLYFLTANHMCGTCLPTA